VPTPAEELVRAFGDAQLHKHWARARAERPGSEYERLLAGEVKRRQSATAGDSPAFGRVNLPDVLARGCTGSGWE
jgi:hypothetical protein